MATDSGAVGMVMSVRVKLTTEAAAAISCGTADEHRCQEQRERQANEDTLRSMGRP